MLSFVQSLSSPPNSLLFDPKPFVSAPFPLYCHLYLLWKATGLATCRTARKHSIGVPNHINYWKVCSLEGYLHDKSTASSLHFRMHKTLGVHFCNNRTRLRDILSSLYTLGWSNTLLILSPLSSSKRLSKLHTQPIPKGEWKDKQLKTLVGYTATSWSKPSFETPHTQKRRPNKSLTVQPIKWQKIFNQLTRAGFLAHACY